MNEHKFDMNHPRTFAIFLLVSTAWHTTIATKTNMFCMTWYCGSKLTGCLGNPNCREGLLCLRDCGRNQECTFGCMYRYGTQQYGEFMRCIVGDNGCITMEAEEIPVLCHPPTVHQKINTLPEGDWMVVAATNKYHDAQVCHKIKITKDSLLRSFMYADSKTAAAMRMNDVRKGFQSSKKTGGILTTGARAGLDLSEEWRVLKMAGDWAVIYRFGYLAKWQYDGKLLLVKPSVDGKSRTQIANDVTKIVDEKRKWYIVDHTQCAD